MSVDGEIEALSKVAAELDLLDYAARRRVLDYLEKRYGRGICDYTWRRHLGPGGTATYQCSLLNGHRGSHRSAEGESYSEEEP